MPVPLPDEIKNGREVAEHAYRTRRLFRRTTRPGSPEREKAIRKKLDEIDAAMRPIRRLVGINVWTPLPYEDALGDVSRRLQHERRSLKKMLRGPRD